MAQGSKASRFKQFEAKGENYFQNEGFHENALLKTTSFFFLIQLDSASDTLVTFGKLIGEAAHWSSLVLFFLI